MMEALNNITDISKISNNIKTDIKSVKIKHY